MLEVIVVVFIIGLVVSISTISISQHTDRYVEDEAKRLHHLLRLATEEAVLRSQELSLMLTKTGYRFALLQGPKWEPITDDQFLREREFPELITVKLTIDEEDINLGDSDKPAQIYLLSSGELTPPFTLSLRGENNVTYKILGNITGEIVFSPPEHDQNQL